MYLRWIPFVLPNFCLPSVDPWRFRLSLIGINPFSATQVYYNLFFILFYSRLILTKLLCILCTILNFDLLIKQFGFNFQFVMLYRLVRQFVLSKLFIQLRLCRLTLNNHKFTLWLVRKSKLTVLLLHSTRCVITFLWE